MSYIEYLVDGSAASTKTKFLSWLDAGAPRLQARGSAMKFEQEIKSDQRRASFLASNASNLMDALQVGRLMRKHQ